MSIFSFQVLFEIFQSGFIKPIQLAVDWVRQVGCPVEVIYEEKNLGAKNIGHITKVGCRWGWLLITSFTVVILVIISAPKLCKRIKIRSHGASTKSDNRCWLPSDAQIGVRPNPVLFSSHQYCCQYQRNESIQTWLHAHRDYIDIFANNYYLLKIFIFSDRKHNSSLTPEKN